MIDNFQGFPRLTQREPSQRVLFRPPIWDVRWMYRVVCPLHPQALTRFHSGWNTPTFSASLLVYLFISPPPPSCSLSISLSLFCSLLCEVLMSGFLMPSSPVSVCHLDLFLFVTLIFLSVVSILLRFLFFPLCRGEMFLQACRGFFVWSAVFGVLVSFEGTNKWYLNLTYPLLAAHEERSSELCTCLTSALDICFISTQI